MGTGKICSMESKLVRVTRYVSPVYLAKFDRIQEGSDCDRPNRIIFKEVKEDNIFEWLDNNALYRLREPFLEHCHSDFGYVFVFNGGQHIVSPSYVEVNPVAPMFRSTQDKAYERRLIIKSQPIETVFPKALDTALRERGFRMVKEF